MFQFLQPYPEQTTSVLTHTPRRSFIPSAVQAFWLFVQRLPRAYIGSQTPLDHTAGAPELTIATCHDGWLKVLGHQYDLQCCFCRQLSQVALLASTTGSENVLAYKADPVGMRSPCKVSCLGPIDSIRLAGTQRHGANIVRGAIACLFMCLLDISRPTVDTTSPDRCEAKNTRQVNNDEPDIIQGKHGYHTLRRPRSDMLL